MYFEDKFKSSEEIPDLIQTGSQSRVVSKSDNIFQNYNELTEVLEKEVSQLKSLLDTERHLKTDHEKRQRNLEFKINLSPSTSMTSGSQFSFAKNDNHLNQNLNFISFPSQHFDSFSVNNCEEKPLNLKKTHDFSKTAIDFSNNNFNHISKRCSTVGSEELQHISHAKEMKNQPSVFDQHIKAPYLLSTSSQLQTNVSPFDRNQSIPSLRSAMSSSLTRSGTGYTKNLELIYQAIKHIEGNESVNTPNGSAYIRHLTENLSSALISHKNQYMKQILTEDYRIKSSEKTRPTIHSVDSLL